MIDTHCHINVDAFKDDEDIVIKEAFESGIKKMIVIGFDDKTNQKAIELAEKYDHIYATVGIHPTEAHQLSTKHLESLLKHYKVVAVGECGTDLYWEKSYLKEQQIILKEQVLLSIKYDLPLVIHTRDSFDEAFDITKEYKGKAKGVFHCFSSHLEDAKRAIDLGFYIGIDGPVTFKNAKDIKEIATHIPLDRILIETDSPYLSPHPHRGKRNEPKYLHLIAESIAALRGIDVHEVIIQTTKNAETLFKLGEKSYEN